MSENLDQPEFGRAEAAARAYLADQAAGVRFRPLDPDAVRDSVRRRRGAGPWLVAAACLAAAVVIAPLALRLGPGAPIAATPRDPGYGWTKTANPPLSPRFGAESAWLGDDFLILGGWDGRPCPPGAVCDMIPPMLRDGARYDPATDLWRTIAAAPAAFGRGYSHSAAALGGFYAVSYADEGSFWRYDPSTDTWQDRAMPAGWGELVGNETALIQVTGDATPAGYRFDDAANSWSPLPAGPLDGCAGRQGFLAGERLVVLAECGTADGPDAGSDLQAATLELAGGTWTGPVGLGATGQGRAVYLDGRLVWPDPLTPASSFRSPGIVELGSGTWQEVDASRPAGPLAYRAAVGSTPHLVLSQAGLVAANGRLLDVVSATWVDVADPPVPDRWDPIRVAAPDSVLDCFGYSYAGEVFEEGGDYATACHLLTG